MDCGTIRPPEQQLQVNLHRALHQQDPSWRGDTALALSGFSGLKQQHRHRPQRPLQRRPGLCAGPDHPAQLQRRRPRQRRRCEKRHSQRRGEAHPRFLQCASGRALGHPPGRPLHDEQRQLPRHLHHHANAERHDGGGFDQRS